MSKPRILITGAAGMIGRILLEQLRISGEYVVIGTDLHEDVDSGIEKLDVCDREAVHAKLKAVDQVIHLAWIITGEDVPGEMMPVNMMGSYNVYEACYLNGVKRIIFGSSNHVNGFYPREAKVTPDMPPRPDSFYGWTKSSVESMGRLFSDKYGMSVINIRIGAVRAENRPLHYRNATMWLSHDDLMRLIYACLTAPEDVKFLTLFGISQNTRNLWELEPEASRIGYHPQDNSEPYVEELLQEHPYTKAEHDFQGGGFVSIDPDNWVKR